MLHCKCGKSFILMSNESKIEETDKPMWVLLHLLANHIQMRIFYFSRSNQHWCVVDAVSLVTDRRLGLWQGAGDKTLYIVGLHLDGERDEPG